MCKIDILILKGNPYIHQQCFVENWQLEYDMLKLDFKRYNSRDLGIVGHIIYDMH